MELNHDTHFLGRYGYDNFTVTFQFNPSFPHQFDHIYEQNFKNHTQKNVIYTALLEFISRNDDCINYVLEHFGTNLQVTNGVHRTSFQDTHFNIKGKNGSYHIFTTLSGEYIRGITYQNYTAFN